LTEKAHVNNAFRQRD